MRGAQRERVQQKSAGISVLETIFVLGVLIMLSAVLLPLLSRSYSSARLASAESTVIDSLREARSRSRGNFQNSSHGIYFNTTVSPVTLTMYQGADYVTRNAAADYVTTLESGATVSLSPSLPDVHFSGSVGTTTARQILITTVGGVRTLTLTDVGFIYEE